jgi:hypothetical protein
MTVTRPTDVTPDSGTARRPRRAPRSARIFGYLLSIGINAGVLWFVTVAPGWRWLPFLTEDFRLVVGLVSLSLVAGIAVNLWYLVSDPIWAKQLGDALTAALAFVVLLQLLRIFPFDLGGWANWETALRFFLGLGCVGSAIGVIAQLASLVRDLVQGAGDR